MIKFQHVFNNFHTIKQEIKMFGSVNDYLANKQLLSARKLLKQSDRSLSTTYEKLLWQF